MLTLGVDDLESSLRFCRDGLGLATEGIVGREFECGAVAFFDPRLGPRLALWPRASIARDAGPSVRPPDATGLTIGHNVDRREKVDAVMSEASRAGTRIVKPAQATFWGGYAGYFQDPDGHQWEVVWNPDWSAWVVDPQHASGDASRHSPEPVVEHRDGALLPRSGRRGHPFARGR